VPLELGVVAPAGQGLGDLLGRLEATPWAWRVWVATTASEGKAAPRAIAAALEALGGCDVVILARGGGAGVTTAYDSDEVASSSPFLFGQPTAGVGQARESGSHRRSWWVDDDGMGVMPGVTLLVGLAVGSRPAASPAAGLAMAGLVIVYAVAFSWVFVWLGLAAGSAQAAQGLGIIGVPFSFLSSAFVPTASMPGVLKAFADHRPLTFMVDAGRGLLDGKAATTTLHQTLT